MKKEQGIDYTKDNVYEAIGRPELDPANEKNCLFQYATKHKVIKDTDLITSKEAEELWKEFLPDIKEKWDMFDSPQMVIWIHCDSNTDYHTVGKEIDFRDCELENGNFYKVSKIKIV